MSSTETLGRYLTVLRPSPSVTTASGLDATQVQSLVRAGRAVLFRGFGFDGDAVRGFVTRYCSRFHLDTGGSKEREGAFDTTRPFVQRIKPRTHAQELHRENGRTMGPPDLLWFWCEQPALKDGETTICDGVRLWDALSPATQALFERDRLAYVNGDPIPTAACLAELHRIYTAPGFSPEHVRGHVFHFLDDDTTLAEFATPAVHTTRFSDARAFCNSITGPYQGSVRFERAGEIPAEVMAELRAAQAALTDALIWERGDLVLLDNSRYLHGRRAYTDLERRVYSVMGDASFP